VAVGSGGPEVGLGDCELMQGVNPLLEREFGVVLCKLINL